MRNQTVTEFGFKPGGFGWHDLSGIGDRHQLIERHSMERESHRMRTLIDQFFQFSSTADTADEINSGTGTGIIDSENGIETITSMPHQSR